MSVRTSMDIGDLLVPTEQEEPEAERGRMEIDDLLPGTPSARPPDDLLPEAATRTGPVSRQPGEPFMRQKQELRTLGVPESNISALDAGLERMRQLPEALRRAAFEKETQALKRLGLSQFEVDDIEIHLGLRQQLGPPAPGERPTPAKGIFSLIGEGSVLEAKARVQLGRDMWNLYKDYVHVPLRKLGEKERELLRKGLAAVRQRAVYLPTVDEARYMIETGDFETIKSLADQGRFPTQEEIGYPYLGAVMARFAEEPNQVRARAKGRVIAFATTHPSASWLRRGEVPEFVPNDFVAEHPTLAILPLGLTELGKSVVEIPVHPERWPIIAATWAGHHYIVAPVFNSAMASLAAKYRWMNVDIGKAFHRWLRTTRQPISEENLVQFFKYLGRPGVIEGLQDVTAQQRATLYVVREGIRRLPADQWKKLSWFFKYGKKTGQWKLVVPRRPGAYPTEFPRMQDYYAYAGPAETGREVITLPGFAQRARGVPPAEVPVMAAGLEAFKVGAERVRGLSADTIASLRKRGLTDAEIRKLFPARILGPTEVVRGAPTPEELEAALPTGMIRPGVVLRRYGLSDAEIQELMRREGLAPQAPAEAPAVGEPPAVVPEYVQRARGVPPAPVPTARAGAEAYRVGAERVTGLTPETVAFLRRKGLSDEDIRAVFPARVISPGQVIRGAATPEELEAAMPARLVRPGETVRQYGLTDDEIQELLEAERAPGDVVSPEQAAARLTPKAPRSGAITDEEYAVGLTGESTLAQRQALIAQRRLRPVAAGEATLEVTPENIHPAVFDAVLVLNKLENVTTYGSGPGQIYGALTADERFNRVLMAALSQAQADGVPIAFSMKPEGGRFEINMYDTTSLQDAKSYWRAVARRVFEIELPAAPPAAPPVAPPAAPPVAPPAAPPVAPPADQAWSMTFDEYRDWLVKVEGQQAVPKNAREVASLRSIHEDHVRRALSEGEAVPPAVLAEYPDLAPEPGVEAPPAEVPAELPTEAPPERPPEPTVETMAEGRTRMVASMNERDALLAGLTFQEVVAAEAEAHDMTAQELVSVNPKGMEYLRYEHAGAVFKALTRGVKVRPEVLAEYPDLEVFGRPPRPMQEVPRTKLSILERKEELLKEIDAAIKKAPNRKDVPLDKAGAPKAGKITFDIDGGATVLNMKETLQDLRKRVENMPKAMPRSMWGPVRTGRARPVAGNRELIDDLAQNVPEGWFADGKIMIKGTPPKKARVDASRQSDPEALMGMLKRPTDEARLAYYGYRGPAIAKLETEVTPEGGRTYTHTATRGDEAVSDRPIPVMEKRCHPFMVFEAGGKYYTYDQLRVNAILKRHKDLTFGIDASPELPLLIAYKAGEPVGAAAPLKVDVSPPEGPPDRRAIHETPPLAHMAKQAGLYEGPAPEMPEVETVATQVAAEASDEVARIEQEIAAIEDQMSRTHELIRSLERSDKEELLGESINEAARALGLDDISEGGPVAREGVIDHLEGVEAYLDYRRTQALASRDLEVEKLVRAQHAAEQAPMAPPEEPAPPAVTPAESTMPPPKEGGALKQLGYTDAQIRKMTNQAAARVVSEQLRAENASVLQTGEVRRIPSPREEAAPELPPSAEADAILEGVEDSIMMSIGRLRAEYAAEISPLRVLKVLRNISPEKRAVIDRAVDRHGAEAVLDEVLRRWQEVRPEAASGLKEYIRKQAQEMNERTKDRREGGMLRFRRRRPGPKDQPEIEDPELREALYAGRAVSKTRAAVDAIKKEIIDDVKEAIAAELDRELQKAMPQFHDDIRTGLVPLISRSIEQAEIALGGLWGDLADDEIDTALNIIGMRDFDETLGEGLDIPRELTQEIVRADLDGVTAEADPHVLAAVERYHALMDMVGRDLVARGKMPTSALRARYMPHLVMEYLPNWWQRAPFLSRKGQIRYRRYTKKRAGSPRDIVISPDAIKVHLATVFADNAFDDWCVAQLAKYDLLSKLDGDEMTDLLGKRPDGKLLRPRSGGLYEWKGERYFGIQFIPGNSVFRAEVVNMDRLKTAIEDAMEEAAATAADAPDIREALRRVRDLETYQEIEEALQHVRLEGGPVGEQRVGPAIRSLLAIGRQHRVYVVPEAMYQKMRRLRDPSEYVPAMWLMNRATRMWKSVTLSIFAAGIPFQMGNLFGDFLNMTRVAPQAAMEVPGAFRMIRHLRIPEQLGEFDRTVLEHALDKAVLESGFAREYMTLSPRLSAKGLWRKMERFSALREGLLRLAMFRYQYKQAVVQGLPVKAPGMEDLIEGLDPLSQAALVGRRFTVDYGAVPRWYGKWVRGQPFGFPFMTFWQKNATSWGKYIRKHPLQFMGKFLAPMVGLWIWNNHFKRDIEDRIGYFKRRLFHINIKAFDIDGDGIDDFALIWAPQEPLSMAAEFTGLNLLSDKVSLVRRGMMTTREAATQQLYDMGLATPNLLRRLAGPMMQVVEGLKTNRDPFSRQEIVPGELSDISGPAKLKYQAPWVLEKLFTPFGQYMLGAEADQADIWDLFGSQLHPVVKPIFKGPLDIPRGLGFYLVDMRRTEAREEMDQARRGRGKWATYMHELEREYVEGEIANPTEFAWSPRAMEIAGEAALEDIGLRTEQVVRRLTSARVQIDHLEYRLRKTIDTEERKRIATQLQTLHEAQALMYKRRLPESVKPHMLRE